MLGRQQEPWVDKTCSTESSRGEAGLEDDPRHEREVLNLLHDGASNYLELGPAAHAICLLAALATQQVLGQAAPLWGEERQGLKLRLLLQESGTVDPRFALPAIFTSTLEKESFRLIKNFPS